MFNKQKKTTQSIFTAFTKDLEEVEVRESLEAERQERLEADAKANKMTALQEASVASKAILNIKKMLTGG